MHVIYSAVMGHILSSRKAKDARFWCTRIFYSLVNILSIFLYYTYLHNFPVYGNIKRMLNHFLQTLKLRRSFVGERYLRDNNEYFSHISKFYNTSTIWSKSLNTFRIASITNTNQNKLASNNKISRRFERARHQTLSQVCIPKCGAYIKNYAG